MIYKFSIFSNLGNVLEASWKDAQKHPRGRLGTPWASPWVSYEPTPMPKIPTWVPTWAFWAWAWASLRAARQFR